MQFHLMVMEQRPQHPNPIRYLLLANLVSMLVHIRLQQSQVLTYVLKLQAEESLLQFQLEAKFVAMDITSVRIIVSGYLFSMESIPDM